MIAYNLVKTLIDEDPTTWHTPGSVQRLFELSGRPFLTSDQVRNALRRLLAEAYVERTETGYTRYDQPKYKYRKAVQG